MVSGGGDGLGQQLVWDIRSGKNDSFRLLDDLDFKYWAHCNDMCMCAR